MIVSHWVDASWSIMTETLLKCRGEGSTPAQTAKEIDAAYPFGQRKHHPYKVWLRERKSFFAKHGLPRNGDHKSQKEMLEDLVSMMESRQCLAK